MTKEFVIPISPENLEKENEKGYYVEDVLDVLSLSKTQLNQIIEGKIRNH